MPFYQQLFQEKNIRKIYHALAPTRLDLAYPLLVRSRLVRGDEFFLTKTVDGEPNSETEIRLLENRGKISLYELKPITGKKHQLRVHMMSLGMPLLMICCIRLFSLLVRKIFEKPLKLLAKRI